MGTARSLRSQRSLVRSFLRLEEVVGVGKEEDALHLLNVLQAMTLRPSKCALEVRKTQALPGFQLGGSSWAVVGAA